MPEHIPSDEMYKYIDCRYTGVVVAARRARQLMQEDPTSAKGKPLLRAFDELMAGKLRYEFTDPPEEGEQLSAESFDLSEIDDELFNADYFSDDELSGDEEEDDDPET